MSTNTRNTRNTRNRNTNILITIAVVLVLLCCCLPLAVVAGSRAWGWVAETKAAPAPAVTPAASMTTTITATAVSTATMGGWNISYYKEATPALKQWKFENLVKDWKDFPNVDFKPYNFLAKDGLEYGMAESAYCQRSQTCDINVPAMHYRLVTGDYSIKGIDSCQGEVTKAGCGIMLVNVGNVTAMFRESMVDYGFTVAGRYWNGETLPIAIRALLSHVAHNMTNQESKVNQGANCSVSDGCQSVRLTFVVISGNEMLLKGTTLVSK